VHYQRLNSMQPRATGRTHHVVDLCRVQARFAQFGLGQLGDVVVIALTRNVAHTRYTHIPVATDLLAAPSCAPGPPLACRRSRAGTTCLGTVGERAQRGMCQAGAESYPCARATSPSPPPHASPRAPGSSPRGYPWRIGGGPARPCGHGYVCVK
jgi:hypothetical protein